MTESQQLLADYAKTRSEAAFRELANRYVDLVFSTALRLVEGDTHRAHDVTQTVFLDLARQAPRLARDTMLGGWLHRDTCFVAAKLMRGERRRQVRERPAVEMNALNAPENSFAEVGPLLDEVINELGEEDRTAILLRFYERRDLQSVGEMLGSTENAAQKRISRALDQLHAMLTRRGIAFSAAALGGALTCEAVSAAPAGISATIAATALAGAASSGGVALTALKILNLTSAKYAAAGVLVVAAVATPLLQQRSVNTLRDENRALAEQVERHARLTEGNPLPSSVVARSADLPPLTEQQHSELLRLRGEVGRLRIESKELETLREDNHRLRLAQAAIQAAAGAANAPDAASPTGFFVRTYKVDAEALLSKIGIASGVVDEASAEHAVHQTELHQFFKNNGIEMEKPEAFILREKEGTLIVRSTIAKLQLIEAIVAEFAPGPDPANPDGADAPNAATLVQRTVKVDAEALLSKLEDFAETANEPLSPNTSQTPYPAQQQALRKLLKDNGIEIQSPEVVFLDETQGILFVRASQGNLAKIQAFAAKFYPRHDPGAGEDGNASSFTQPTAK